MLSINPKVTVFIPVYNREKYIKSAIESVLSQDFSDFELLIIDDGSSDESLNIIQSFTDPRIRIHRHERNHGIPYTRNHGLELAKGEYIALLDSDDRMAPQRLTRQVTFLDRNPSVATVGGWVKKVDQSGKVVKTLVKPLPPEELKAWLLFRCSHANTSLMGRVAIMREYKYRAEFAVSQDYDLSERIASRYQTANLPWTLSYQLEHCGRISNERAAQAQAMKSNIIQRQLVAMGLAPTEDDLAKHHDITRVKKSRRYETPDYFDWGKDWIAQLCAANQRSRQYDQRALHHVLNFVWGHACLNAAPHIGIGKALNHFRAIKFDSGLSASTYDNFKFALHQMR